MIAAAWHDGTLIGALMQAPAFIAWVWTCWAL